MINLYYIIKKNNKFNDDYDFSELIKDDPEFINDFSSIINNLKNNKKLKLVSKIFIEKIYEYDDIKDEKYIKYYSGNNKLIIKYKTEEEDKALLIINPLNENEIDKRCFIILMKNKENNNFFQKIIDENNFHNKLKRNKNVIIIPCEKYLKILKFLVHIYYYEKELLSNNKENIFKENEEYYLINSEWLNKFKEYYDYKSLNITNDNDEENKKIDINYNNIEINYNKIIIKKNLIVSGKRELLEYINNPYKIKSINQKKDKILYNTNCYIINNKIFNIIKSIYNNDLKNIKQKEKIILKNNNIYLIYPKKIIIGNFNEYLIFFPKYIFL